ncbi:MAG: glycosyltransferase [Planctomycetes bacterium]|nr:glycosyltransferase [Planctomycetota bacterium]
MISRLLRSVRWLATRLPRRAPHAPLAWGRGLTVLVPERGGFAFLGATLQAAERALAHCDEPSELLVVTSGAPREAYTELALAHPAVRWIHVAAGLHFLGAVERGLRHARFEAVYLLNSDMLLEEGALREVLRWRGASVFAVASQIFFADPKRRREETGWTDLQRCGDRVEVWDHEPDALDADAGWARSHLYAGGGSSLFHGPTLRRYARASRVYRPFYFEDAEWGVRAWRDGLEVLFAPGSRAHHLHRKSALQLYSSEQIDGIARRNEALFLARSFRAPDRWPPSDAAPVARWTRLRREARWALHEARDPFPAAPSPFVRRASLPRPLRARGDRSRVLVVSPYALFPPAHGGAVRLRHLLHGLAAEFEISLLSDEQQLYGARSRAYFEPFASIHLVGGRSEVREVLTDRVARVRNHSHATLGAELSRLIAVRRPHLVQVEFVELCDLRRQLGPCGVPWAISLHDVLFDGVGGTSEADRYERERILQHEVAFACSEEDLALLDHPGAALVRNGIDGARFRYLPSPAEPRLLFLGPFRYPPNLEGIRRYLEHVHPRLLARFPGIAIDLLGGVGAREVAARESCFAQPGVAVHDYVEDVGPWLERSALTLNPQLSIRGSSVKLIESLAAGRVCVSTDDGARGFAQAGFAGLLTAPRIEDFAVLIEELLLDVERRRTLERPDAERLQPFTWQHAVQEQARVWRSLIEAQR